MFNPYSMASGKPPPPPQSGMFDPYGLSSSKSGAPNSFGLNANKPPGTLDPVQAAEQEAAKRGVPGATAQTNSTRANKAETLGRAVFGR